MSASAATYQDLYNFSCGSAKWKIVSNTTGNTQHYRSYAVSAYWYGSSVRVTRTSHLHCSGTQSSVETAGANRWVYSASASCV